MRHRYCRREGDRQVDYCNFCVAYGYLWMQVTVLELFCYVWFIRKITDMGGRVLLKYEKQNWNWTGKDREILLFLNQKVFDNGHMRN